MRGLRIGVESVSQPEQVRKPTIEWSWRESSGERGSFAGKQLTTEGEVQSLNKVRTGFVLRDGSNKRLHNTHTHKLIK